MTLLGTEFPSQKRMEPGPLTVMMTMTGSWKSIINWQYSGNSKQLRHQTTSYLYRGETLLKEYTGEGSPLAEYYTANGRVIARNMFGFHDRKTWGNADTIRTRGGLMYYHYDPLGRSCN